MQEMQAEIERLKVEIASTPRASPVHTSMKNVMLVAGIKDWTVTVEAAVYLNFLH